MIYGLAEKLAKFDLGFVLVRLCMLLPVMFIARALDAADFGDFSKLYHQVLLLSSLVIFGVQDKISVEQKGKLAEEMTSLLFRFGLLSLCMALFTDWVLAACIFFFCLVFRCVPMLLFPIIRLSMRSINYLVICLSLGAASLAFSIAHWLGWGGIATIQFASVIMLACLFGFWIHHGMTRPVLNIRAALTGWDYFFNFLFTSFYIQGVMFLIAFVSSGTDYAFVTRVVYLVQIGLIFQGIMYRTLLVLLADGGMKFSRALSAYTLIGAFWFLLYLLIGKHVEWLFFGEPELTQWDYVAVGAIIWLHTYNAVLAPYLVVQGKVKQLLAIPLGSLLIAMAVLLAWDHIGSYQAVYIMLGSLSCFALLIRLFLFSEIKSRSVT